MEGKVFLSFPADWQLSTLHTIVELNSASTEVCCDELYGALPSTILPSARLQSGDTITSNHAVMEYVQFLHSIARLRFSYLLNVDMGHLDIHDVRNEVDRITSLFGFRRFTVASLSLALAIRQWNPDAEIVISTVAGIQSVDQLEPWLECRPDKVVLHHDANRNWYSLKELVSFCTAAGLDVELLATESCVRYCSQRAEHYRTVGLSLSDRDFHKWCNTLKIRCPAEILKANFIRPEDLHRYVSQFGITRFKISGRSKPQAWQHNCLRAYMHQRYQGNLMSLLGIDPLLHAEDWLYVDNGALDGFLDELQSCSSQLEEHLLCERKILQMYQANSFRSSRNDLVYCIRDGKVVPDRHLRIYP